MNCETVQGLFSEYYDERSESAADITRHLSRCNICRQMYNEYREMLRSLRHLPEPTVSDELHASLVFYAIGYSKGSRNRAKNVKAIFGAVCGAVTVAIAAGIAVFFLWSPGMIDRQPHLPLEIVEPAALAIDIGLSDEAPLSRSLYADVFPEPEASDDPGRSSQPIAIAAVSLAVGFAAGFTAHALWRSKCKGRKERRFE